MIAPTLNTSTAIHQNRRTLYILTPIRSLRVNLLKQPPRHIRMHPLRPRPRHPGPLPKAHKLIKPMHLPRHLLPPHIPRPPRPLPFRLPLPLPATPRQPLRHILRLRTQHVQLAPHQTHLLRQRAPRREDRTQKRIAQVLPLAHVRPPHPPEMLVGRAPRRAALRARHARATRAAWSSAKSTTG